MVIPVIFLAFLLSIADSAAKTPADTMHTIKNIVGGKQAPKYLRYNCPRFSRKSNDKNDPKAGRKNAQPSLEVWTGAGIPAEDYLDTCVVSGFGINIPLKERLSLSFDLGYWKSAVDEVPAKFYDGHLKAFPLLTSLQFFLSGQNRVNPYIYLGGGYIFTSYTMKDIITIPEISIDQSVKNGLCLSSINPTHLEITDISYCPSKIMRPNTIHVIQLPINTQKDDFDPFITPDGKKLFFASNSDNSDKYWDCDI
jgi:hypothetical protein